MTTRTEFEFMPLTLSIETLARVATPIIRRGTPLPTKRKQQFSTTVDNQKAVKISVFLGERPLVDNNVRIGDVELGGLEEAPKGEPEIDVLFEVDRTCTLKVTATERKTATSTSREITVPGKHLTPEQVDIHLKEANDSRSDDEARFAAIEARNEANSLIHRAEKYLQDQQRWGLGSTADQQVEEMVASLGLSLQQDDTGAIKYKNKRLSRLLPDAGLGNLGAYSDVFGHRFREFSTMIPSVFGHPLI